MTPSTFTSDLRSICAALDPEGKVKVTPGDVEDFLDRARVSRHPGDFDDWPSDSQMEYFKRGGR